MRRRSAVHIVTQLELGGAQRVTLDLLRCLAAAGWEVGLITGVDGPLVEEARGLLGARLVLEPALVRAVRPHLDLTALARLTARLRRLGPDVVHTHSSKAGIVGRAAARLAGTAVVVHSVHGFPFQPPPYQGALRRRFYLGLERLAARWTDAFTCDSEANRRVGEQAGLFRRSAVEVIASGVDLEPYRRRAGLDRGAKRLELGLPPDVPVVAMIACLKPQKAPLDYVAACGRIARELPRVHFLLIGDGELRPQVEAQVAADGLEQRFHLLGWRRDLPELVGMLDLALLTSLWEGLPQTLPIVQAAGVPVVATRVDGNAEAVLDGETGFLVAPGDSAALAGRALEILRDPELHRRMAAAGPRFAARFDLARTCDRMLGLYQRLLARASLGEADA
ncbi:MAG TPA: glycosyltransferase family 4 protein [Acidobacteriota bacterium]